jgi:hypothetical protein
MKSIFILLFCLASLLSVITMIEGSEVYAGSSLTGVQQKEEFSFF